MSGQDNDSVGAAAGGFRLFGPTTLALRQRTSVMVLLAIIAVVGLVSYVSVPKESRPEIIIPIISVSVAYPGVAPKDMETLVTRVIEEEINTISDLKVLRSTSVEGYSNVTAEFNTGMDMEEALQKVREKVDLAKAKLPADAREPSISEMNLSELPIMQVNISGAYDLVRLKDVAEDVKKRLEQIPSILEVQLSGGLEREVQVDVDLARLQFYGLAFVDVIDAIRDENVTIPGGAIDVGNRKYLVRVNGEFQDPGIIREIVVATRSGRPIYVRDVASVDFGFKERNSFARLDGNAVVTLGIVKRAGENIIKTSNSVKAVIAEVEPDFPASTVVKITSDESEQIFDMVTSLENNIISGLILVVAVLLFFLGVRNSAFVAISIPLSMLLSFAVMNVMGMSMNMIVLFSLILALGMLVDNAIVIVENVYRFREEGYDNAAASLRATGEVAMPVIASTATTVAAFTPLMFWPGIVGEFMGYLPKTLIITLSSSLFVALVIVPVLCALFMKLEGEVSPPLTPAARWSLVVAAAAFLAVIAAASPLASLLLLLLAVVLIGVHRVFLFRIGRWFQTAAVPFAISRYERRLRWALDNRLKMVAGAAGVLVGTVLLFGRFSVGVEFFPESIPPSTVYARVDVPDGTSANFTNAIALELEREVRTIPGIEDAKTVVATVGGGGSPMGGGGGDGSVAVNFKKYQDRTVDVFETLKEMQERLGKNVAGADVKITKPQDGPTSGKPVNLEIVGDDSEELRRLADRAIVVLQGSPVFARLEGLESDMAGGRPELVVEVDREKAALYGLTTTKVGRMVRTAIQGSEAAKYRDGNDEYDIMVRLAEPYRNNLESLADLTVVAEGGRQIPLPSVASWRIDEGFGTIKRKDMDRVATVSSDVRAGENTNAVLAEVQETLAGFAGSLPQGYYLRYTGQNEEQAEASAFLTTAFGLALMLIAFILITQFNSVVKPLIILTAVLMSTVGVLVGLMIFRMPFGVIMTGVGVISLAGIVVNNAIVLIDYVDVLREKGGLSRREALVKAGITRFRPVVLTAITTVLGLVPLATGFNFDFLGLFTRLDPDIYWGGEQAAWWAPMAIAVIVGLSFATVLTLVLVPVMYSILDDASDWVRRKYTAPQPVAAMAGQPALAMNGPAARPAMAANGYREPKAEELDEEEEAASAALAYRVRTWFRHRLGGAEA